MKHRAGSRISKIKSHLARGLSITQLDAISLYNAFRLASDVQRLRGEMVILTHLKESPSGTRYAEYATPRKGDRVRHLQSKGRGVGIVREVYLTSSGTPFYRVQWGNAEWGTYTYDNAYLLEAA